MLAYHNDQTIKDKYVARMIAHRKADEVVQGIGYQNGRGCAIGCTLNNYSHKAFEDEIGVPVELAHLFDALFESLPKKDAPQFAQDFLEAIPVGADLSKALLKFKLWLLKDKKHGAYQYADAQGKKAINKVATLLRREIGGVRVRQSTWAAARAAAWAAARAAVRDAARAAARAAAGDAARAAAGAAAWVAAGAAAWVAARAAARAAAGDAAWAAAGDAARDAAWAAARAAARAAVGDAARAAAWAAAGDAARAAQAAKILDLLREAK